MKIAFIMATNEIDVQWSAPLAFGYLKAAAERACPGRHEFRVLHSADEITREKPDLMGISCMSQDFDTARELAAAARVAGVTFVILGGQHITAFPETLPPGVDLGVLREGEVTFVEVLELIERQERLQPLDLADIKGIVYRDQTGAAVSTSPRPILPSLDDLPFPDRDFGRLDGQKPYLFSSRGCPYQCNFCASSQYWDNTRFHGPERVLKEVEEFLNNYPRVKSVGFWDDLFAVNRKRVRAISEAIVQRGFQKKAAFSTSMRADVVDDELCTLLTRMNLKRVGIGAESGSDRVLKKLKNPYSSVEKNQHALDIMAKHKMQPGAGFIFGHYDETEEDIHETYRWIMGNYAQGKLTQHEVNILTPMPSTPVWTWAVDNGLLPRENVEWHRLRYLTMNANNLGGLQEWIRVRRKNRSLYLNEKNVPLNHLYEMIDHYESRIRRGDFGKVKGKRGAGTAMLVRQFKKNLQGRVYRGKIKLRGMRNLKG
ncbi:MAG: B12-binding domain-containing radical SAM protein [Gemmatimonadales bacterium]|nr:B12-binding domain-containing radical SAM protein [Gemmatimonadales bacterium]